MSVKKVLALGLALLVTAGALPVSAREAADYTDLPESHWAYGYGDAMTGLGLINGMGNGVFAPDDRVTAAMLLTLVGREVFPQLTAEPARWWVPYLEAAREAGWLEGTAIDPEDPHQPVSRCDMAAVLAAAGAALDILPGETDVSAIRDYDSIPEDCREAVAAVYSLGLINGDHTGCFNGDQTMSRAEAAAVLWRLTRESRAETDTHLAVPDLPAYLGLSEESCAVSDGCLLARWAAGEGLDLAVLEACEDLIDGAGYRLRLLHRETAVTETGGSALCCYRYEGLDRAELTDLGSWNGVAYDLILRLDWTERDVLLRMDAAQGLTWADAGVRVSAALTSLPITAPSAEPKPLLPTLDIPAPSGIPIPDPIPDPPSQET